MSRTKIEKRQEIERKVVRHLIRTMKEPGWIAVGYYPSIAKAIGPARQFAGV